MKIDRYRLGLFMVTALLLASASASGSRETALWPAVERLTETDLLNEADVQRLLGARLKRLENGYFLTGSLTRAFSARRLKFAPFDRAGYEIFRRSTHSTAESGASDVRVVASATLILWIDGPHCIRSESILEKVDPLTFSLVENDHSQEDDSVVSAAAYQILGRRVAFGFRKDGASECVRYAELSQESQSSESGPATRQ